MAIIQRRQGTYHKLNLGTIDAGLLAELYDDHIVFIDPLHRIEGLPEPEAYFPS